jgi:hypothetical protein
MTTIKIIEQQEISMPKFTIGCTSDKIWNINDLLNFLISNQNDSIKLNIEPEAICLENLGLYKLLDKFNFKQVNINTWNPLEVHSKYNILYLGSNVWFSRLSPADTNLHAWNQKKIFYCLFGRPTASRLGLAGYLFSQHPTMSHIHFSALTGDDDLMQFELDKLLGYRIASIQEAGDVINKLPLLLSSPDRYTKYNGYDYSDPLTQLYQDIFVDILSESHVSGNTFFPTEKTIRPMWLKKPFIVFGSRCYLAYLRQMGFRTFNDFWSENYDGYEGRDRFVKILKLIDSLAQKSLVELQEMYWNMQYTLEHNYNLLLNQSYNTNITYIS